MTSIEHTTRGALALVGIPAVWAAHFMLSYVTAAIWCAKVDGGDLGSARLLIAAYTLAALATLAIIGVRAWRRYRLDDAAPEDRDSPGGRRHFIAFATLLLAGLGTLAIVYTTLATVLVGSCR